MESAEKLLKRLQFKVVRRLDGMLQGDYRGLFAGPGLELAEVREYQEGDEIRRIDWNVTARTGRTHVRQFVEERELTAWLLLDLSPSVDFGSTHQLKRDLVVEFAALAAYLLTRHGDKIGALGFGGAAEAGDLAIPPGSGRRQAVRIVHQLLSPSTPPLPTGGQGDGGTGRVSARPPVPLSPRHGDRVGRTDLGAVLRRAGRTIRRRSLVFVVSDFLVRPGWELPLKLLAQRHDVVAVRVRDPREGELPNVGHLRFEDPETGAQLWVDTGDRRLRERYRQAAAEQEAALGQVLRSTGVDTLSLSTAESPIKPLVDFINYRKRKRRWTSSGH